MTEGFLVILPDNKFLRFLDTKGACQQVVMVTANQLSFNDFRNVGQALIMQDSIRILPVSAQFLCSNFLRLTIFCLQLYQLQFHTSNTSLIEAFRCQLLAERFLGQTYIGEGVCLADNDVLQGRYVSRKSARYVDISQQRLQMLKDFCILSLKNFFLILAPLRVVEQSISGSINLALAIINVEMVARQLLGLANLVEAQALYLYEQTQVVMINQHQKLILAAFRQ